MPENVVRSMDLTRNVSETQNRVESVLKRVFSADIVKNIIERLSFLESDGEGIAYGFSHAEALNVAEDFNTILGAAEDFIVRVISESLNMGETIFRVLGLPVGADLVRSVAETLSFEDSSLIARAIARIRQERQQISEIIAPNRVFSKIISETVDLPETTAHALSVVALTLVQEINEVLFLSESRTKSIVRALGLVEVVNETMNIIDRATSLPARFAQIIFDFTIKPVMKFSLWINKDLSDD